MKKINILAFTLLVCLYLKEVNATTLNVKSADVTAPIKKKADSLLGRKINDIKHVSASNNSNFRTFSSLNKFDHIKNKQHTFKQQGYIFKDSDSIISKKRLEAAVNTFAKIEEDQQYIDELSEDKLHTLPVGLRPKVISNIKYAVGIAKATFKPKYTELTVFLKIEIPNTNSGKSTQVLILGASNVKLSHSGGIVGDAKLHLISQFIVNINKGAMLLTLKGSLENPGTYARIDCFGFKELSLDANIKFSNSLIFPVDANGDKKLGYVEADFKIVASDWNDIVTNISLPEFGIKGVNKTTFKLNTAVLDFSDLRNDSSMPSGYLQKHYAEAPNLWRGVYVKSVEVVLPKEFKIKGQKNTERVSFSATNLILDRQGVTGIFEGKNIFDIGEGNASGWNFSVASFKIDIETNKLKSGEFSGKIALPVSSKEEALEYKALIQPENYNLIVSNSDNIDFDVWKAKVVLYKDSYIEMSVKDGKFRPKASLNGLMSISAGMKDDSNNSSKKIIDFKGIEFQKLVLQTEAPMFSIENFGIKGKLQLAKFPISINKIGFQTTSNNQVKMFLDYNLHLTSETDGGNGAFSKMTIKGILDENSNRWKYDGVDLEKLAIKMDVAGAELTGNVFIFENNPKYDTGFAGAVNLVFKKGNNSKFEVKAKALFGRTNSFRYWFADAQATFPSGIPIFTGFALNSFGGGLYSRMKMAGISSDKNASTNQIGASSSGVIYEPYQGNSFGMKASVGIITQNSENLFNATVEYGMSFKSNGGLQEIYLRGSGELLSALPANFYEKVSKNLAKISNKEMLDPPSKSSTIGVGVFISYDFVNDVFHSTSDVYVNLPIMKGVGNNGRAGWIDLYIASNEWHILLGTPTDPLGVKINLGFFTAKSTSYFMAGDNLPDSAPLPSKIANKIPKKDLDILDYTRNLSALNTGKGLAFGAGFDFSTGDLSFLIFYARFDAGVGFDIMMRDYKDAHCKGSSKPIGVNGWYANGKAYAYLQGKLGLTFKLFGFKRKISILSSSTAIILQARLPNPTWLRGYLVGDYNLLGGLIKGSYRFRMEMGDKCEIVGGSALDGLVVIGDMSPKNGSSDVDVFSAPQVAFNMQINKTFSLADDEGEKKYRIKMNQFSVKNEKGETVIGDIEWNERQDVALFYSHEVLPPNSKLKAKVVVIFERNVNGAWETIKENGKISTEEKEIEFTTGDTPKTIQLHNIAFMYPVLEQKNFFKNEYSKGGYIKLKRGRKYLFENPNLQKEIFFTTSTGNITKKEYSYNPSNNQLNFTLPTLTNETLYNVEVKLVSIKKDMNSNIETSYTSKKLSENSDENNVQIKKTKVEGTINKAEDRVLLGYKFKTSKYNTLNEKLRNTVVTKNFVLTNGDVYYLTKRIKSQEPFDLIELVGSKYSGNAPLVKTTALLSDAYYKKDIYPLLYKDYPLSGTITVGRDISKIGIPPKEAVEPISWYLTYLENDIDQDIDEILPFKYNLPFYYNKDYTDLGNKLFKSEINWQSNSSYTKLIENIFPTIRNGEYKTNLQYILPGGVKKGSSYNINYKKL